MLKVDEKSKTPLYVQLYQQIKRDILAGTMKAGTKLKSSRAVSAELHISRNTVESAYAQLYAEGFISSRPRKGYYVELLEPRPFCGCLTTESSKAEQGPASGVKYDFRCGQLLLDELPCNQWQRLITRCFHDYRESLARQGCVFGERELRAQIQRHLYDYRHISCSAEQIVITPGTQFCLGLVCQLLNDIGGGQGVAMEEPGYHQSRITLQNSGLKVYPAALDEHGVMPGALSAPETIAAYITPSHQFPTGTVMPLSRRTELARWAARNHTYVIEDDYNCHFQHGLKPLPALQSLCADRVFYIGGFSDILLPCIRVAYMVVPQPLWERLHGWFKGQASFVPFLTQKPLELFMKEGHWESHLRKMRKRQKDKCEALVGVLKSAFGDSISVSGFHAGLHLLLTARWPGKESELVCRACRAGVGVYPTSKYWRSHPKGENATVLLNYGGVSLEDIPVAVNLLYEAWLGGASGAVKDSGAGACAWG